MKTQNIPRFMMLVGLPGCGKSTYAAGLEKEGFIWLSSDAIRAEMGYAPGEGNTEVFKEMAKRAKTALLEGHNVVFDATNLGRKKRMNILNELKNYPGGRECILFTEPFEECERRNSQRTGDALVPDHIMKKMLKEFQTPMEQEGFDTIKIIQTTKGRKLQDFLEMSDGFSQDNHHHDLTLIKHLEETAKRVKAIIQSPEIIPESHQSRRRVLQETALYHDIGKLFTKEFKDSKGNPSEEAHFYGHDNAGAYLYLTADKSDSTELTEEETLHVARLINWHMRPYAEMKESKREAEKAFVGEKFWQEIQIIHEADAVAHKDQEISATLAPRDIDDP